MKPLNLSFEALAHDYASGRRTPAQVIDAILEHAAPLEHANIWITRLTRAQIQPYLDGLAERDPATCPLYGLPFAIKDNIDLAGVPTTAGCAEFAYTPERSAFVVERLIEAGAIPIGKTNLDQFATGLVGTRSPYGAVANAFDAKLISGGSSSGSAVAVAQGLVSFALGTDTAGSGRVPAAFNNLVGLKPTRGVLSTAGVVPACRTLDCVSILALTAGDAKRVFDVAAVFDVDEPYSRAVTTASRMARPSFRFGVPAPEWLDFDGDTSAQRCFDAAVETFESLGGTPVPLEFGVFAKAAALLYDGPWVAERYAAIREFINDKPEALLDVTRAIIEPASALGAVEAFEASYRLAGLRRRADTVLADLDFVVTPTAPRLYSQAEIAEQPIARNSRLGTYTNFMNLLDLAAVATPAGFTADGLPTGVTLFAPAHCDHALLIYAQRLAAAQRLPSGATTHHHEHQENTCGELPPGWMKVAVCGAHLEDMPLNHQLTDRGAVLVSATRTARCYRLYALPGGPPYKPALIRADDNDYDNGKAIEVEVWALPETTVGSFLAAIPAPLGLGSLELADGSWVIGFICEGRATPSARDITAWGGWRAYQRQ